MWAETCGHQTQQVPASHVVDMKLLKLAPGGISLFSLVQPPPAAQLSMSLDHEHILGGALGTQTAAR